MPDQSTKVSDYLYVSDTDLYIVDGTVPHMPNRVAELESAVAQLQATVDGLRGELVDANERIRALERELEGHDEETAVEESAEAQTDTTTERATDGSGTAPGSIDDIIVA